jgi:uncharacterized protein YndB with AHSA1/START domain
MVAQNRSALTVTLPSDREIHLSRVFDAPRHLVFEAFSKPEHMAQWWGPRDMTLPVCEMDFRPGGAWHVVHRDAQGNEFGFRGEFRDIVPPERIARTFEFEGMPGHISLETVSFEEFSQTQTQTETQTQTQTETGSQARARAHGLRTRITVTSVFASVEDRDGMLQSGMERGASETFDRLAEYLRTMA